MIKRRWEPEEEDGKENAINIQDKAQVKGVIVDYMCQTPPDVQRQVPCLSPPPPLSPCPRLPSPLSYFFLLLSFS